MPSSGVDVAHGVAVGRPVVEGAPALGVMLGERVVEDRRTGFSIGGEAVARGAPFLAQGVEVVERAAQHAELVGPAVLHPLGGKSSELCIGGGQQVAGAPVDVLERCGGVGVALALAQPVGVVVMRPAVEIGVLVGVDVPGVEDLLGVVDVVVEVLQELDVGGAVEGNGDGSCRIQRREAGRAVPAFAGAVAGLVVFRRRAARACALRAVSRVVCAATTCSGVRGLGVCSTL